jgi:hypothetical protein
MTIQKKLELKRNGNSYGMAWRAQASPWQKEKWIEVASSFNSLFSPTYYMKTKHALFLSER